MSPRRRGIGAIDQIGEHEPAQELLLGAAQQRRRAGRHGDHEQRVSVDLPCHGPDGGQHLEEPLLFAGSLLAGDGRWRRCRRPPSDRPVARKARGRPS
ncbi:MAG: hypothetical protein R2710_25495 [Acidimicrobiales bacterium]